MSINSLTSSREWVDATDRGSSKSKEGFPCQTSEGINVTVGISIGASVTEDNAAKFLAKFGVNPPQGDRTDPAVIFTSVYYGKSLVQVMDTVGRREVQSMVCSEISKRTLDQDNSQVSQIMATVKDATVKFF